VNWNDAARNALENLGAHRLRTALTMLGMVFGVAAVIAMLSIGAGAEQQAMEMIDRLGARNLLIRDVEKRDDQLAEIRKTSLGVSMRDVAAILDAVPGLELAAARCTIDPYSVLSDGMTAEATLHGVSWQLGELTNLRVVEGRFLDALDEREHSQVCVIGETIRHELFGYEPVLGRDLKVNDVWLEVVGVLARTGTGSRVEGVDVGSTDREIYTPVTTAIRKFDRPPLEAPLDEIVVRLAEGSAPDEAASLIAQLLERLHGGADDYELVVPHALLEQSRRTQRLFSLVMGCIAGISLLVGGIGIMNIMLATVLERTREIGIRRAVGARQIDIRNLFLMESFSISLLGGLTGIIAGLVISKTVALSAGWPTVVTPFSVLLSFTVSVTVGLISGLYPAIRAAELNPIDALRYE
jgi:putative ABC transport system permease protein